MPERVLGPGATGTGKKADQTDPAEETVVDEATPETDSKPKAKGKA